MCSSNIFCSHGETLPVIVDGIQTTTTTLNYVLGVWVQQFPCIPDKHRRQPDNQWSTPTHTMGARRQHLRSRRWSRFVSTTPSPTTMKHGGNVNPSIICKADGVPAHHQNCHTMDGVTVCSTKGSYRRSTDASPTQKEIMGAVQRACAASVNL